MIEKRLYDSKMTQNLRVDETVGATQTINGKGIIKFSMTLAKKENEKYCFVRETEKGNEIIFIKGIPSTSKKGLIKLDRCEYSVKRSDDDSYKIILAKAKAIDIEAIIHPFPPITPKPEKTIIRFLEKGKERFGIFMGKQDNYQEGHTICMTPLSTDYGILISDNKKPTAILLNEREGRISLIRKIEVNEEDYEYSKFYELLHKEGLHNIQNEK